MMIIYALFLKIAFAHSLCSDLLSAVRPQTLLSKALKRSHTKFENGPAYLIIKNIRPVGILIAPSLWNQIKSEHFTLHERPASTLLVSATSIFQNLGLYDAVIYRDNKQKIEAVLIHTKLMDWPIAKPVANGWSFDRFENELPLALKIVLHDDQTLKLTHKYKLPLVVRKLNADELPDVVLTAVEFKSQLCLLLDQVTETNAPVIFKIQNNYVGVYRDTPEFN